MALEKLKLKLVGVAPIMFHNERLANPTDPGTRELKKLTANKNKTDDLFEQIKKLEWRLGFYEDEEKRPVVTSDMVLAATVSGARKLKKGKEVSAGVLTDEPWFPLVYDGPKTIDELYEARYVDYRSVVISGRRTMRSRPIFRAWSLPVVLMFDKEIINGRDLRQAVEIAGERIGMGERRPRLGRFIVES